MTYVKAAVATAIAFLVIDLVWISFFVSDVYNAQVGNMMRDTPNVVSATAFYIFYVAGILYFAVRPALADGKTKTAFVNGALLGVLAYGTYTLTNHAVFSQWSWVLVYSDIAWGAFLTGSCAAVGYLVAKR